MTDTLFLGRKASRPLEAPDLELKPIQRLDEYVDLSSYYAQPAVEGLRLLDGQFETIKTGTESIIYDALVPGSFVARRNSAYSTQNVRKHKIALSMLVATNNPTAIVWDYLEAGYSGVYFRSAYGSYHLSPMYYVDKLQKGKIEVFSAKDGQITGVMGDRFVTVSLDEGTYKAGSLVEICWIQVDEQGCPHHPLVIPSATHPRE